jgi:hypothetical protein
MLRRVFTLVMLRGLITVVAITLLGVSPAKAAHLVYERDASREVVAAYADGSHAHVIARGRQPTIAPNGRLVGFFRISSAGVRSLYVVPWGGGRERRLASGVYGAGPPGGASLAWSRDSRFVVVGDESARGSYLINVKRDVKRLFRAPRSFGDASFSPRDNRFVVVDANDENQMYIANASGGRAKRFTHGVFTEWGRPGVAFTSGSSLALKPVGRRGRVLLAEDGEAFAVPAAWSSAGDVLLAAENMTGEGLFTPALVRLPGGDVTRLPQQFADIYSLSHDGTLLLAETADGSVVSMATDGTPTTKVLAAGATEATWTR